MNIRDVVRLFLDGKRIHFFHILWGIEDLVRLTLGFQVLLIGESWAWSPLVQFFHRKKTCTKAGFGAIRLGTTHQQRRHCLVAGGTTRSPTLSSEFKRGMGPCHK